MSSVDAEGFESPAPVIFMSFILLFIFIIYVLRLSPSVALSLLSLCSLWLNLSS